MKDNAPQQKEISKKALSSEKRLVNFRRHQSQSLELAYCNLVLYGEVCCVLYLSET
jgi:hypothetical protein